MTEPAAPPATHNRQTRSPWGFLLRGAVAAGLALGFKLGIEATPAGHRLGAASYEMWSKFVMSGPPPLRVVCVDISHLEGGERDRRTGAVLPTPRQELFELVQALSHLGARGVLVDVDMSPDANGYLTPEDPRFLDEFLKLNETTPIRLGVYRTVLEKSDTWLGKARFAPLAASTWLPRSDLRWLPVSSVAEGMTDALPSLGASLLDTISPEPDRFRDVRDWLSARKQAAHLRLAPGATVDAQLALINYGVVDRLEADLIPAASAKDLARFHDRIKGSIAIVGSTVYARDHFPLPGRERDVPGMLVHGAVVHTLLVEPLAELSLSARLWLDLLATVLVLAAFVLTGVHSARTSEARSSRRTRVLFTAMLAIFGLGVALATVLQIFWTDCALVVLVLSLHPRFERLVHRCGAALGRLRR